MLEIVDKDDRDRIEDLLTGPLNTQGVAALAVDPEAGIVPPAWWDGDDDATQSSFAASTW